MRAFHYAISLIFISIVSIACASTGNNTSNLHNLPQFVDLSVNGILLKDPASSVNVLGEISSLNTEHALPSVRYTNKDHTEVFVLYFHHGDIRNSFSEFKVTASDEQKSVELEGVEHFVTGKGIRLGMSRDEVVTILGEPHNFKAHDNAQIIEYRLEGINESDLLRSYNMPIYYGNYKFVNNRLIEFLFGFEYP